ncbi:MAG: GNAT family N-acetyltransferase [Cohaesibacteraceae bacterium]|nr:GNAT family N-acetyltransferase [Cohaesibacteraceae bacterium]
MEIVKASKKHVPEIIALLADDYLGKGRENVADQLSLYEAAFDQIQSDPNNDVFILLNGETVVGCLQLTLIAGLSITATKRAQIEGVRVHSNYRGKGLGHKLFEFAIENARSRGAGLVQLTTNRQRMDAHRFYDQLGFVQSHIGYKLKL